MDQDDREKALDIAIKFLGEQLREKLKIVDELPSGIYWGDREEYQNCWIIWVPSGMNIVGASRYILISKSTGKVVLDGKFGE